MNNLTSIGQIIAQLIESIAVIDLTAVILQGSSTFKSIRGEGNTKKRIMFLGLIGGIFGIYATIGGYQISGGSVISIRDVGPMMAGCLGGPLSGLIAGLIAGIQRLIYGLPDIAAGTAIPCSISTLLIGVICGRMHEAFANHKMHTAMAVILAAAMEVMHMLLVFLYTWMHSGLSSSLDLISVISLPFIIANSAAFGTMTFVLNMIGDYQKTEKKEKMIESELGVATTIQMDTLPKILPDFPGRSEFTISASMNTAKEVGGDFYDFFFLDDSHIVFLIADVSGKGVPAALFMVIAKTLLKNNLKSGLSAAESCTRTNHQLCESSGIDMFVTAWVGVLDIPKGRMTYVNCGHNPPLLKRAGRPAKYLKTKGGFVLAGLDDFKYTENELLLNDGDFLLLYTDGITEAMNQYFQQYGDTRLQLLLNHADHQMNPDMVLKTIDEDVRNHTGEAEQSDDQTMLGILISGSYHKIKVKLEKNPSQKVYDFVEQQLKDHHIPDKIISVFNIAIDELYSNIYKYSGSSDLIVGVSCYPGHVSMQMEYAGKLFDMSKTKEPDVTLAAEERREGGLGLMIVRRSMDDMQYIVDDKRNIFTVVKNY